jgi:hypothetical protein
MASTENYIELRDKLRVMARPLDRTEYIIEVSKEDHNLLDKAFNYNGKGHCFYSVDIEIGEVSEPTIKALF